MSNLPLGQIITTEQHKDAIHVAVAPVEAGEWLAPGAHVRLAASGKAVPAPRAKCIGIVDPFLPKHVVSGERFWLFLYPNTITSLRHDWAHPAFVAVAVVAKPVSSMSESEAWMRSWAKHNMGENYYGDGRRTDQVAYEAAIEAGHTLSVGPYESARETMNDEWWGHWEKITGEVGKRDEHFSCGC